MTQGWTVLTRGMTVHEAVWPGAIAVALIWDRLWGEPPEQAHPVVWMGRYLSRVGQGLAPGVGQTTATLQATDWPRFWAGALAWTLGALPWVLLAWALQRGVLALGPWPAAALLGLMLKPLLAWRMLREEVLAVEAALGVSLEQGRARLARLVSRDVSQLSAEAVRESAIESLAENLNDSVLAPLFWFALAGLPGAALYRFANTADAMWGYPGWRGEGPSARHWAWAGKWAARVDDGLSWLPARLGGWLLCPPWTRGGPGLRAEARKTPSPNSGWPMAAMALRLGVRLGKPGVYVLNPDAAPPEARHSALAAHLAGRAVWVGALFLAGLGALRAGWGA